MFLVSYFLSYIPLTSHIGDLIRNSMYLNVLIAMEQRRRRSHPKKSCQSGEKSGVAPIEFSQVQALFAALSILLLASGGLLMLEKGWFK